MTVIFGIELLSWLCDKLFFSYTYVCTCSNVFC